MGSRGRKNSSQLKDMVWHVLGISHLIELHPIPSHPMMTGTTTNLKASNTTFNVFKSDSRYGCSRFPSMTRLPSNLAPKREPQIQLQQRRAHIFLPSAYTTTAVLESQTWEPHSCSSFYLVIIEWMGYTLPRHNRTEIQSHTIPSHILPSR